MYVFISNRLFHLTNDLKDRIVPHDNNMQLARNAIQAVLASVVALSLGWLIQRTVVLHLY